MTKVIIEQLDEFAIEKKGIRAWPLWEKEISRFDWHYDSQEMCYILEGEVTVEAEGESVAFQAGDFVTFPSGMDCVWNIKKDVRKHYSFS